uniref:adenylate/guanylate cyclase domain-containing protein n=1 Tax=Geminicoccus flavidas TaxID=2506407 RepID=UPI00135984A3
MDGQPSAASSGHEVAAWLRALGLERYSELFSRNEIGFDALPYLKEDDLKELGLPLGPRRVISAAISQLLPAPVADDPPQPDKPAVQRSEGERRQLTVMFCDLAGSTALSRQLDPELLCDVLRTYQNVVAGEVARFEGHVAKFMGDGVLAYFGWPAAHENEAERAISAGLAITEAVAKLEIPTGGALAVRVGIATGMVVVGELIGDAEARERAVVGETPNLAARLQAVAQPGTVVVAHSTRQLVGELFEFADLGAVELRGYGEPVHAWLAVSEGHAEGRFVALRGAVLPLVGRDHELGMLVERWHWAAAGEGQVILLSGEPGIGKSRIAQAFRRRLYGTRHTWLSFQCSPFYANAPLFPVIEHLSRAMGTERDTPPETKLEKLEELIGRASEAVSELAPLFASLLSIPTGARYPALDMTPQRQKEETLQALMLQVRNLSRKTPVAMIWEDLHWLDPTSLELLDLIVESIRKLPVCVLCTFRPEFRASWIGVPHITALTLNRLGRQQTITLAHHVARGKALPTPVLDHVVDKTDGVPLFIEELTRAIIESGALLEVGDQFVLQGPLESVAVPSSLHDSLMARLDRLESTKETAQLAAVIGREFSYDLIRAVSTLDEPTLQRSLAELVNSELVLGRGTPPAAHYMFKHALVRDAAYESLLRADRKVLHARIADIYESRFPERATLEPELLAYHFTRAALTPQAVRYWLKAGERALARSANKEAISHLRAGIDLLDGIE